MSASLSARLASLERDRHRRLQRPADGTPVPPSALALLESGAVLLKRDDEGPWVRFDPWPAQADALADLHEHRLCVWLKARQLGMTWLALAFALWLLLHKPGVTVLLFSRRDDEACELLRRLKGMAQRLPPGLRPAFAVDNGHELAFASGSRARCFPCTAGDSYTAALVIVDEAALVPDLKRLLASVKPTIDNGGRLLLLSRANKSDPGGLFAATYRAAASGATEWRGRFLPWSARPGRDAAWYEAQKQDVLAREGSLDTLWEQYPATAEEALAPRQSDKRLPLAWLQGCWQALPPRPGTDFAAALPPGLRVWVPPQPERKYVIGGDPAEGNPTSDDSAACVLDADTGKQAATLVGKIEPTVFAAEIAKLSRWYHNACVLPERNNHGHALIAGLKAEGVRVLKGHDGKEGWLSSERGKVALYDGLAEALRDGEVVLHDQETFLQLASIVGGTLRAPEGQRDDLADACALAVAGMGKTATRGRTGIFGR